MPAAPCDHLAGLRLRNGGFHHRHDLVPTGNGHEIELERRAAYSHIMAMPLDETRDREIAIEFQDLRPLADVVCDLGIGSDGYDATVPCGKCLSLRQLLIDGDDLATPQHEVGSFGRRTGVARGERNRQRGEETQHAKIRRQHHGNAPTNQPRKLDGGVESLLRERPASAESQASW